MSLTNYQRLIVESIKEYDFIKNLSRMVGRCHDALIGEWINWWFGKDIDSMICNPARGSKLGSKRYTADLLFLERFKDIDYYEVKGIAEIENNEEKILDKIISLSSYEKYKMRGKIAYPDLEFLVHCYTIKTPNDELNEIIYDNIIQISENSNLLWIVCDIGKSLQEQAHYSIHIPNYAEGYDLFYYNRNIDSINFFFIKKGKQIGDIFTPGIS